MNIEMAMIEVIGLKTDLQRFVSVLREAGCVHIDNVSETPEVLVRPLTMDMEALHQQEDLSLTAARIDGLLEVLGIHAGETNPPTPRKNTHELPAIKEALNEIRPVVQELTKWREELDGEMNSLPLYETTLRKLTPLVPAAAHEPGNVVVGVLVNRANVAVLDLVGKQILELSHGTAKLVSSDVGESTRAMLIVIKKELTAEVETLLGQKDVSRLRLPPGLGEGLPANMLENIHRRLQEIPQEQKQIEQKMEALRQEWAGCLLLWKAVLQEEMEGLQILSRFGETDTTFVLVGWVPKKELPKLKEMLREQIGEALLVQERPLGREMKTRAPVVLSNPLPARPFESLVRMLELPRYNHIDPTTLMSLFLPVFFGLMLGDIGYGALLLVGSLLLRRKYRAGFARDLMLVIAIGSAWAIVFGVLFGEVFGTLGETFGLHPIWMSREKASDVQSLLLLSVAIGAGHIVLSLILGLLEGLRDRSRAHLLERGGMLLGLIGLFLLVGVMVDFLPQGFMTPAIAGLIIGVVLLSASLGWLGIFMGPIEFISLIGNVLSYMRIAAIGLASVYLAKVANEMVGTVGNIVVGLVIAVLIHALNLVMGAFSPTIHSLRLHYVESFRKFYEGGGREYEPFRHHLTGA